VAGEVFRLGIDFGTSNTVAMLAFPDGRIRPLLFDGSPLLPSAVHADPTAGLLTGRDAAHAARTRPDCFEPHPKRCVDDGTVLLGQAQVPVTDLVAAVLSRVAAEASRVTGGPLPQVVLTCPADWGPRRRQVLRAAARAVFGDVTLVTEPEAAASYFVAVARRRMPPGSCLMVYDLGAGTFDASVVRRTADGFEVLAVRGLRDVGGLDVDAAVVAALGATYRARDEARWTRLVEPRDPADRRASRDFWEDVRAGKELLSRAAHTTVHVPLFDDEAPLGREHLERLAEPILDRTVDTTRQVLADAHVAATDLAGLFLVGGASRMPLAAALLHRRLRVAPTVVEQPELVVAEGALYAAAAPAGVAPSAADELVGAVPSAADEQVAGGASGADAPPVDAGVAAPNGPRGAGTPPADAGRPDDAAASDAGPPPEPAGAPHTEAATPTAGPPGPTAGPPGPTAGPRRTRLRRRLTTAALVTTVVVAAVVPVVEGLVGRRGQEPPVVPDLPASLRDDCGDGDVPPMPGARRTLGCRDARGREAVVGLFADRTGVEAVYDQAVRESGVTRGEGDCVTGQVGEHRYPATGPAVGRVLCVTDESGATRIVWTDERIHAVARAEATTPDAARALHESWLTWTAAAPAFPTDEERSLVDLLGATDCRRADVSELDDFPGAVAGVTCNPRGVGARTVSYYRFGAVADLQAAMDAHAVAADAPTGVDCDGDAPGFRGSRRYDLRSVELGVLLCHPGARSTLVMEWSVEALLVAGRAVGTEAAALTAWWRSYSGPPVARTVEAVNAQSTPPFPTAAEAALLAHIPQRSRVDCLRPSDEQVRRNVGSEPVVAVVCGPTSGAGIVFYYQFPDAAAMRRSYGNRPARDKACTALPRPFAGEAPYRRGGLTGWLRCGTNENGRRWLEWTTEQLGIQAFAFNGGDPAAMIDWWRHDAGPV